MNSPQETQLGHELRQIVSGQPFTPDIEALAARGMAFERLDQLALEHLYGIR